jgi:hypothetical protein
MCLGSSIEEDKMLKMEDGKDKGKNISLLQRDLAEEPQLML